LTALREPTEKLHAAHWQVTLALLGEYGSGKINQALANSAPGKSECPLGIW